jgi:dihydrofolate reductase
VRVTIIAAVAENRAIGRGGGIPWHLPADLKFFQRATMGRTLIMGRRTFESAGPLPGRTTIVLTRDRSYRPAAGPTGSTGSAGSTGSGPPAALEVAHDLDEALARAEARGEEEVFVCGGAGIYRRALDRADRMLLTRVEGEFEADTFFPEHDPGRWRLVRREEHAPDEKNPHGYAFEEYERKPEDRRPTSPGPS